MTMTTVEPQTEEPVVRQRMTLAEFNALPEDQERDRFLLRGELWDLPMTKRNRRHATVEAQVVFLLKLWIKSRGKVWGQVLSGEVGCDFPELDTGVSIDVAVFSAEVLAQQHPKSAYITGAQVLAVEVLSPSDTIELIHAKVQDYLAAGVKFVWTINVYEQTVTVFTESAPPMMLRMHEELVGDPHLPGLVIPVSAIFE